MPTTQRPSVLIGISLGLLPWLAAWLGSYVLHSAIASFLFYHVICLGSTFRYRSLYAPLEKRPFPRRHWIGLSIACIAVCAACYFLIGELGWLIYPATVLAGLRREHIALTHSDLLALFLYFACVNPAIEEWFWRGSIYTGLRQAGRSVTFSTVVSSLLFGSWHWLIVRLFFPLPLALLVTAGIVAFGILVAVLYERTRSLPAVWLVHAIGADLPILIVLWFGVVNR